MPNVWLRPPNERREADTAKALLSVPDGDHLTLLNVYNLYKQSMCLRRVSKIVLFEQFDLTRSSFNINQTLTTKNGLGTIISRHGRYPKRRTSVPSF